MVSAREEETFMTIVRCESGMRIALREVLLDEYRLVQTGISIIHNMLKAAGTTGERVRARHLTCPDAQLVQRYPVRPGILSGQGNEPK